MKKLTFSVKTAIGARSSLRAAQELKANEVMSAESLELLSKERAAAHARYAMTSSPFYRDFYSSSGFRLSDLDDPAAFDSLPILDKQIVRENFDSIRTPEASPKNSVQSVSGGSTGEPLRILRDLRAPTRSLEWRLYRWWGANPWDNRADLYRQILQGRAKLRHDVQWWPSRRLHLNARDMSDHAIATFAEEWNRHAPRIFVGYVGGVLELARALERLDLRLTPPHVIALTAAPLPDGVRAEIESVFRAPAYDHYRSAEIPWMAGECRARSGLHTFSDVRRIEVVDKNDQVAPIGVSGEVVASDLTNRVFPLLRYRLGDVTQRLDGACDCGVNLPRIAPVRGRVVEALRLPQGGVIAGESLTGLFSPTPHAVRQFQLVQASDYSVTILCVRGSSPHADAEITQAAETVRDLGRGKISVEYRIVDAIPHVGGKTRFIISDAPA